MDTRRDRSASFSRARERGPSRNPLFVEPLETRAAVSEGLVALAWPLLLNTGGIPGNPADIHGAGIGRASTSICSERLPAPEVDLRETVARAFQDRGAHGPEGRQTPAVALCNETAFAPAECVGP